MDRSFLMADMGGTNIRFAVCENGEIKKYKSYKCADFPSFSDVLKIYKNEVNLPKIFVLAVPGNKIENGIYSFVNNPWLFSLDELKLEFSFSNVVIMNDFQAVSYGLLNLSKDDVVLLKTGNSNEDSPKLIMGAGTGLGVGVLLKTDTDSYHALSSEGGHISVSVQNKTEEKIHHFIKDKYGRVSAERLISGQGIQNIYEALTGKSLSSERIVSLALEKDKKAVQTLLQMFAFWGDVAGDLALAFVAKGGLFLTGNIIQSEGLLDLLRKSDFVLRFEQKGRHCDLLKAIPVYVVFHSKMAFLGLQRVGQNLN